MVYFINQAIFLGLPFFEGSNSDVEFSPTPFFDIYNPVSLGLGILGTGLVLLGE